MQKRYYVDSCIWLNLFKKEGDASKGKPYWQIAEEFIEKVISSQDAEIIYSPIILREIENKLDKKLFNEAVSSIENEPKFMLIKIEEEDYGMARKFECASKYSLSFYDCLNMAVCIRLKFILITRDKKLLEFARWYLIAEKPESVLI